MGRGGNEAFVLDWTVEEAEEGIGRVEVDATNGRVLISPTWWRVSHQRHRCGMGFLGCAPWGAVLDTWHMPRGHKVRGSCASRGVVEGKATGRGTSLRMGGGWLNT